MSEQRDMDLRLGDCLDVMRTLGDGTVDCVVTSPPYDTLRKYRGAAADWGFDKFKEIASELVRILADGGVIVWNVNDATENGGRTGTSFRQCLAFMELGLKLNDTMIWRKTNPLPQVRQPRYAACFEYMFILSKGKPKAFNPIMRKTKFGGSSYNSTCKNMGGESGRTRKDFTINDEAIEYNVWDIAVAQNKTCHPAVFPYELAYRHVISWTDEGDLVCDPFMGTGTTGAACVNANRRFIGMEKVEEYFNIAKERIEEEIHKPRQLTLF